MFQKRHVYIPALLSVGMVASVLAGRGMIYFAGAVLFAGMSIYAASHQRKRI